MVRDNQRGSIGKERPLLRTWGAAEPLSILAAGRYLITALHGSMCWPRIWRFFSNVLLAEYTASTSLLGHFHARRGKSGPLSSYLMANLQPPTIIRICGSTKTQASHLSPAAAGTDQSVVVRQPCKWCERLFCDSVNAARSDRTPFWQSKELAV